LGDCSDDLTARGGLRPDVASAIATMFRPRIDPGASEWHWEGGAAGGYWRLSAFKGGVRLKSGKTLASNSFSDSFVPAFVLL
jgi:hypothetical protein